MTIALRSAVAFLLLSPLSFGEIWTTRSATLHKMDVEGGLHLEIPICGAGPYRNPLVTLVLRHSIQLRGNAVPYSLFSVPQLRCCLVPTSSGGYLWSSPGGGLHYFDKHGNCDSDDRLHLNSNSNGFTITSVDDEYYIFSGNYLNMFIDSSGDIYDIETCGPFITQMALRDHGEQRVFLRASYANGQIQTLSIGAHGQFSFKYRQTSPWLLVSIADEGGKEWLHLEYDKGLVTRVAQTEHKPMCFSWKWRGEAFSRGDHRDRTPVQLLSDGERRYKRNVLGDWIILSCETNAGGKERMAFNFRTGAVSSRPPLVGFVNSRQLSN